MTTVTRYFFRWLRRHAELIVAMGVFVAVILLIRAVTEPNDSRVPPTDGVTEVTGWALPLLVSSLALGFIVMAVVQLIKPSLRVQFHRNQISRWLKQDRSHRSPAEGDRVGEPYGFKLSIDEFLQDVSQADPDALLELPIEQLAAQVQAAVDLELASGGDLPPLVWAVIGIEEGIPRLQPLTPSGLGGDDAQSEDFVHRRGALSYQVQRRLDALQIEVRQRWRKFLRLLCMLVSVTITSVLATIFGYWGNAASTALVVILLSALGIFFASVARDAVAILERFRT
jgi:hypothetical protein